MSIPETLMKNWLYCGIKVHGAWSITDERHYKLQVGEHLMLLVVESGRFELTLPKGSFVAKQGEAMLLAPSTLYPLHLSENARLVEIRFSLIPAIGVRNPFHMVQLPVTATGTWPNEVWRLPEGMNPQKHSTWYSADDEWRARRVVDELLHLFMERAFAEKKALLAHTPPGWFQDVLQAAELKLSDPDFTPGNFAQLAGCSADYLNRIIRETEGTTTSGFLRKLRIKKASYILRHESNVSSTELAERCGFTSQRQFREQWRLETGLGIREYRKTLR